MSRDNERPLEDEARTALYDQLTNTIEGLPAGSLSNGQKYFDSTDVRTWGHAPEGSMEKAHFDEFFGPDYEYEGLTANEKQALYSMGEKRILATGQHHVEQAQEVQQLAGRVLFRYRMLHGDYEDDATLQRAGQRLLAKHGEAVVDLAREDPDRVADMLDDELLADMDDFDYSEDTGGRTGGMGWGSRPGSGGSRHQQDDDGGDGFDTLRDWQTRHGFTF